MRVVVILWARGEAEVHQMSDGRLALAVVERTHGELLSQLREGHSRVWLTHRLDNGILVGLSKTFGALVLLLAVLIVPWGG